MIRTPNSFDKMDPLVLKLVKVAAPAPKPADPADHPFARFVRGDCWPTPRIVTSGKTIDHCTSSIKASAEKRAAKKASLAAQYNSGKPVEGVLPPVSGTALMESQKVSRATRTTYEADICGYAVTVVADAVAKQLKSGKTVGQAAAQFKEGPADMRGDRTPENGYWNQSSFLPKNGHWYRVTAFTPEEEARRERSEGDKIYAFRRDGAWELMVRIETATGKVRRVCTLAPAHSCLWADDDLCDLLDKQAPTGQLWALGDKIDGKPQGRNVQVKIESYTAGFADAKVAVAALSAGVDKAGMWLRDGWSSGAPPEVGYYRVTTADSVLAENRLVHLDGTQLMSYWNGQTWVEEVTLRYEGKRKWSVTRFSRTLGGDLARIHWKWDQAGPAMGAACVRPAIGIVYSVQEGNP